MMGLRDRFDRSKRKKSTRRQRVGFALFWLLVLTYAYVIAGAPNFNTESHLYLTFSMVDHHSLNINPYQLRLGDKSYANGLYYSDKAPGLSFLAVPVYAGLRALFPDKRGQHYEAYPHWRYAIPRDTVYIRYAITYLLLILPSAIFAVLIWLFLSHLIPSEGWALVLTLAYAAGTLAMPYSTMYFSHQIVAMLLFGAFLLLFWKVRDKGAAPSVLRAAALAGFLVGYAVISEYPAALIGVLLGLYLLAVSQARLRMLGAFIAGMVPPASLGAAYNLLAFGKPFSTGYMHVQSFMYHSNAHGSALGLAQPATYGIQPPSLTSLWEITFGTYRGLFLVCPVLLLFFVGIIFMWRRRDLRPEFWLCLAVVVLYFLMDASRSVDQNGWSGGSSIASRHLTPMLPFMIIPIAFALHQSLWRLLLSVLGAISFAMMFMAVATVGGFSITDHNPIVHEMLPRFFHGKILANWGYLMGQTGFRSLVPFCVVATLLGVRLFYLFHLPRTEKATIAPVVSRSELEAS